MTLLPKTNRFSTQTNIGFLREKTKIRIILPLGTKITMKLFSPTKTQFVFKSWDKNTIYKPTLPTKKTKIRFVNFACEDCAGFGFGMKFGHQSDLGTEIHHWQWESNVAIRKKQTFPSFQCKRRFAREAYISIPWQVNTQRWPSWKTDKRCWMH